VWNNTGDKVILRHADGSEGHLFLAAAFAASATAVLKERRPPVRLTLTWDQGSEMPGTILLGRNITDGPLVLGQRRSDLGCRRQPASLPGQKSLRPAHQPARFGPLNSPCGHDGNLVVWDAAQDVAPRMIADSRHRWRVRGLDWDWVIAATAEGEVLAFSHDKSASGKLSPRRRRAVLRAVRRLPVPRSRR
jgi:hypothetical protein